MPYYDFNCGKCGQDFDLQLSIKDDKDDVKCPCCGAREAQRNWGSIVTAIKGRSSGSGADCGTCSSNSCAGCH